MEQKMKLFNEIAAQEDIAAKLTATEDPNEMVAILAENGLELTIDELAEIANTIAASTAEGELNEEDLDNVSGGNWVTVVIVVAVYIVRKIVQYMKKHHSW